MMNISDISIDDFEKGSVLYATMECAIDGDLRLLYGDTARESWTQFVLDICEAIKQNEQKS